jgi:hypothetical protein
MASMGLKMNPSVPFPFFENACDDHEVEEVGMGPMSDQKVLEVGRRSSGTTTTGVPSNTKLKKQIHKKGQSEKDEGSKMEEKEFPGDTPSLVKKKKSDREVEEIPDRIRRISLSEFERMIGDGGPPDDDDSSSSREDRGDSWNLNTAGAGLKAAKRKRDGEKFLPAKLKKQYQSLPEGVLVNS